MKELLLPKILADTYLDGVFGIGSGMSGMVDQLKREINEDINQMIEPRVEENLLISAEIAEDIRDRNIDRLHGAIIESGLNDTVIMIHPMLDDPPELRFTFDLPNSGMILVGNRDDDIIETEEDRFLSGFDAFVKKGETLIDITIPSEEVPILTVGEENMLDNQSTNIIHIDPTRDAGRHMTEADWDAKVRAFAGQPRRPEKVRVSKPSKETLAKRKKNKTARQSRKVNRRK